MKRFSVCFLFLAWVSVTLGAKFPISDGLLQTPLNGGGNAITNVTDIKGTSGQSLFTAVTNGLVGPNVTNGLVGPAVTNGLVGPAVTNGFTGISVTNGLVGPAVTNGLVGPSITNGFTGVSVTNGLVGPAVTNGLVGPSVTNGLDTVVARTAAITAGTNGLVGPAVTNGLVGPAITNGFTGVSVTNGLVGPAVTNGLVGPSVTNGLGGLSGIVTNTTTATKTNYTVSGAGDASANGTYSLLGLFPSQAIYSGTYSVTIYSNIVNAYTLVVAPGGPNRCDIMAHFPSGSEPTLYLRAGSDPASGSWTAPTGTAPAPTSVSSNIVAGGSVNVTNTGYYTDTFLDAPVNGNNYGRSNGNWVKVLPEVPASTVTYGRSNNTYVPIAPEAPSDSNPYARSNGVWTRFSTAGGGGSVTNLPARFETIGHTNSAVSKGRTAAWSTNFSQVGTVSTGFSAGQQRVEVSGQIAVVSGTSTSVKFISLTNPAAPVVIFTLTVPSVVNCMGHLGPFFYLMGDNWLHCYSVTETGLIQTNSTQTVDSSNPKFQISDDGYLVTTAFTSPGKIRIYSLANPGVPQEVSNLTFTGHKQDAIKVGNYVYVADYVNKSLDVVDLTIPSRPFLVSTQQVVVAEDTWGFEPWRLHTDPAKRALYLADDGWMKVYSLANATNPVLVVQTPQTNVYAGTDIEGSKVVGDLMFWFASGVHTNADAGISVWDLQSPLAPTKLCQTNVTGWSGGYYWGDVDDNYIYLPLGGNLIVMNRPKLPRFEQGVTTLFAGITNPVVLPYASNCIGCEFTLKVTADVTNVMTPKGTDLIDFGATMSVTNRQARTVKSDGMTNWFWIGGAN